MYQKREDREERGYFEVVPEVLLGAFAVVRRVGGFGGESPWRFVSFCWSENFRIRGYLGQAYRFLR
jgi:hypothetical protein